MKQVMLLLLFLSAVCGRISAQSKKDKTEFTREYTTDAYGLQVLYAEGKKYGQYSYTDLDGNQVIRNLRTGDWVFYYPDGKVMGKVSFRDNKYHGMVTTYYPGGKLKAEVKFKDGLADGDLKEYYEDGSLQTRIHYDNGKIKNPIIRYYTDGTIREELEALFLENESKYRLVSYILYYPNGKKLVAGMLNGNREPRLQNTQGWIPAQGVWSSFWEDGKEALRVDFNQNKVFVINTRQSEKLQNKNGTFTRGQQVFRGFSYMYIDKTPYIAFDHVEEFLNPESAFEIPVSVKLPEENFWGKTGVWENLSADGKRLSLVEYDWTTDQPEGSGKFYYPGGSLKSEGVYKNGKLNGEWKYYFENGQLSETIPYNENGEAHGVDVEYFRNGSLCRKTTFVNGVKEGIQVLYHPNGKQLTQNEFRNDKLISTGDYYDKDGTIMCKNGTGVRMDYYTSGNLSFKGSFSQNKNSGLSEWFFENGKLQKSMQYTDGIGNGPVLLYFESGSLMEKSTLVNDKTEGITELYYPGGNLLGKQEFKNNTFVGPFDFFDEKGTPILSNGTGYLLNYHPNGKISYKAQFINYCRDGKAEWYYANGQLKQSAVYKYAADMKPSGLRWEAISSYAPDGQILESGTLKNGTGTWLSYDDNGKYVSTLKFKDGKPVQ